MADEFPETDLDTPSADDIDQAYGSRFLGVVDIGNKKIRTKISKVRMEEVRDRDGDKSKKPVAAELDTVKLDSSDKASLQLDSDPTSGSYQLVSLFSNNLTALRCEIKFGALALRSTSVTMLTGYAA